jgi:serine/threonine-protein kinase
VAGYCLERELGRGGMAVVWLAQRADAVIKRQVALKLPLQSVATATGRARFAQEKDVLAELEHPHIARLYDAGVDGQQPFIALEFVDGLPITRYCDQHGLDLSARLRLFLQVLAAVDHAHRHLVVHRDLKPSNILVDTAGQVKLLDFGIAKLLIDPALNEAATLTQVGSTVLTPIYSAPEQAAGQAISTSTDIFVLGVVLHELLTGTLPYAKTCGDTPALAQIVDALLRSDPTLPSQAQIDNAAVRARASANSERLRAMLRGDLDTMVSKALSYDPTQRYGSAESFADDVRRYLEHRPIQARPHGAWYAARLFLRRHRVASLAVGAALLVALLGATAAELQYFEARANAERAIATRDFMFDTLAAGRRKGRQHGSAPMRRRARVR